MDIINALKIDITKKQVISIVGAGGKTTLLHYLSKKFEDIGKKVLLTTTAHIYVPSKDLFHSIMISDDEDDIMEYVNSIHKEGLYLIGDSINNEEKLKGLDIGFIDKIYNTSIFDFILVEADGSKKKPIKAPADWEPMIPKSTTAIIGVIGLDSLGRPASEETIHRLNEFCAICGCRPGDKIGEIMLADLINHPQGLFKNAPQNAKKILMLNKADDIECRHKGFKIKSMIKDSNIGFVITSLKNDMYWM